MLKVRCEACIRLILCEAVKDEGKSFCGYECRLNWLRVQRRYERAASRR